MIVVGLTANQGLLDDRVKSPVKLTPLTIIILDAVLPLYTVPKSSDVTLGLIVGGMTPVPVTLILVETSLPRMNSWLAFPSYIGLYVTVIVPPLGGREVGETVNSMPVVSDCDTKVMDSFRLVPVTVKSFVLVSPTLTSPKS